MQNSFENYVQTRGSADQSSVFSRYGIRPLYARFLTFFKRLLSDKFPALFFAGVFAAIVICVVGIPNLFIIKPRNTLPVCLRQFKNTNRLVAGENFCSCIHERGERLDKCLNEYNNAPDDITVKL
jgi:hypothetical protein